MIKDKYQQGESVDIIMSKTRGLETVLITNISDKYIWIRSKSGTGVVNLKTFDQQVKEAKAMKEQEDTSTQTKLHDKFISNAINICNTQKSISGKAIFKVWKSVSFDVNFLLGLEMDKLNALKGFCMGIDVDVSELIEHHKVLRRDKTKPVLSSDVYKYMKV